MKNKKQQPKIKNILNFILLICVFSFTFYAIDFNPAYAQSLNLTAPKSTQGDYFQVTLSINTQNKPINTVSGTIKVSPDKLRITDVRYGNSIITLWVERPALNASAGTITFAGGAPGGFNGSNGPILTFFASARTSGIASVSLENVSVLLNDGLGTVLNNVNLGKLDLAIDVPPPKKTKPEEPEPEETPVVTAVIPIDDIPPEDFVPIVSRNPGVENNKYFVSFFSVVKDTRVSPFFVP